MTNFISLYQHRFNLQNATFSLVEHEDAIVAIVYKVTQSNGTQLILKICKLPNHYFREIYFLKYFANKLAVPHVIQVVEPQAGINGAILMECLSGTVLKVTDLTEALAHEMGLLLATIHLNRTSGYGDLIEQESLTADPRRYFTIKFEESLSECRHHLSKALLEQCQSYYDTYIDLLGSVDGPCMVHRDFRPGNVMVQEGKIQGIIDWSSGGASFAEEDFCSLEHEEWSNNPLIKKSFLTGYTSIRPIPNYIATMPLLRLSKALAVIGFLVKRGIWKSSQAHLYQYNRRFLERLVSPQSRPFRGGSR
jgi:Ser/Thr protein kinase RdoA (MazF antagonist)